MARASFLRLYVFGPSGYFNPFLSLYCPSTLAQSKESKGSTLLTDHRATATDRGREPGRESRVGLPVAVAARETLSVRRRTQNALFSSSAVLFLPSSWLLFFGRFSRRRRRDCYVSSLGRPPLRRLLELDCEWNCLKKKCSR